jgi:hypothetical protein
MKMFIITNVHFFINDFHETKFLNMWMILTQNYVSFISCIFQMFCLMYECCVRFLIVQLTYVIIRT